MKKNVFFVLAILLSLLVFTSCEENLEPEGQTQSILPEKFSVDIPDAISRENVVLKSASVDTLQGNDIYQHLNTFIHVGEAAAEIVEGIIGAISYFGIDKPLTLTYISDDDNRTKNLVVTEAVNFEGQLWDYQLTITDALSEVNSDGGKALQVIWDKGHGNGINGVAILKPYNINRDDRDSAPESVFRIDYSELGENGYDAQMIVQISGLPLEPALVDPYSVNTLKMFVGKNGDYVDVYGNTNHPHARFFTEDVGFNWAFVASGSESLDIGVAEVGLPPSNLDATSRKVLLEDYSIRKVFSNQIYELWPLINDEVVNAYLTNTAAPGYFNEAGFIQGGTSPGTEYESLEERILDLSPYNPKEVSGMIVLFN